MPSASLRPKNSEAPRCGQAWASSPTFPEVVRKAIRFSPSKRTRSGGPSGAGSSEDMRAGIQYWRMRSPMGVPGPTRVSSAFSSALSIAASPIHHSSPLLFQCVDELELVEPIVEHPTAGTGLKPAPALTLDYGTQYEALLTGATS